MNNRTNRDGFTLVEMLVVLAIMAASLAISLPYVRGSGDARSLDVTAQIIAARLRESQALAVSTNAERILGIDLKKGQLNDPVYSLPSGTSLKVETVDNQITADLVAMKFFADGGSTGGKITLSKGNEHLQIAVNWLTGAVVIEKLPPQ
jgi:general secretion pathway protein H